MKKINFQFYATHDEIQLFIDQVQSTADVYAYLIQFIPVYEAQEVHRKRCVLNGCSWVYFSECKRELNTYEEYLSYSKMNFEDLIMYIGDETKTELRESHIGASAEHMINPKWRCLIDILRKTCMKGAYVVTPQNIRQYYPDIRYSKGAEVAYQEGKTIRPTAGWNRVEFILRKSI